jgi:hypothetical protein
MTKTWEERRDDYLKILDEKVSVKQSWFKSRFGKPQYLIYNFDYFAKDYILKKEPKNEIVVNQTLLKYSLAGVFK